MVAVNVATKKCRKCGQVKAISDFHKRTSAKDGVEPHCKLCKMYEIREYRARKRARAVPEPVPAPQPCQHVRSCGDAAIEKDIPGFFDTHERAERGFELQVCRKCGDVKTVQTVSNLDLEEMRAPLRMSGHKRAPGEAKPVGEKKCRWCGESTAADAFYHISGMKDGHDSVCKACRNKRTKYIRQQEKEAIVSSTNGVSPETFEEYQAREREKLGKILAPDFVDEALRGPETPAEALQDEEVAATVLEVTVPGAPDLETKYRDALEVIKHLEAENKGLLGKVEEYLKLLTKANRRARLAEIDLEIVKLEHERSMLVEGLG